MCEGFGDAACFAQAALDGSVDEAAPQICIVSRREVQHALRLLQFGEVAAELARAEAAPADGPEGEEKPAEGPEAAAVPARKRGRPKKTEGGEKAEPKKATGKRQKSLFDF